MHNPPPEFLNNSMKEYLTEIGINIGMSIAGLFGSLILIGKQAVFNLRTTIASILAGVASANYLTPVVAIDIFKLTDERYHYSIAFILGFLGLKGVEKISEKVFKSNNQPSAADNANDTPNH